jgi:hypothetical protein
MERGEPSLGQAGNPGRIARFCLISGQSRTGHANQNTGQNDPLRGLTKGAMPDGEHVARHRIGGEAASIHRHRSLAGNVFWQASVSGETSTQWPSAFFSTTVRQTPAWVMESPKPTSAISNAPGFTVKRIPASRGRDIHDTAHSRDNAGKHDCARISRRKSRFIMTPSKPAGQEGRRFAQDNRQARGRAWVVGG